MALDEVKSFIVRFFKENMVYFSLVAPAFMLILAMLYNLGILCYILIILWFSTGLTIVFLPSHPETNNG